MVKDIISAKGKQIFQKQSFMRKKFVSMCLMYHKIFSFANYIITNEVIHTEHYA